MIIVYTAVSYTHLDVYKRQVLIVMFVLYTVKNKSKQNLLSRKKCYRLQLSEYSQNQLEYDTKYYNTLVGFACKK